MSTLSRNKLPYSRFILNESAYVLRKQRERKSEKAKTFTRKIKKWYEKYRVLYVGEIFKHLFVKLQIQLITF